jgi:hypothetical protein
LLVACATAVLDSTEIDNLRRLTRATTWKIEREIKLAFPAHHPQGMVVVGDDIFLSSVEVNEWPQLGPGGRSPGAGAGHLYRLDRRGELQGEVQLGEGDMYHPGGLAWDGEAVWVSVAEYRPNSHSVVYRVTPELVVEEIFRFDDHLGGLIYDRDCDTLHALSWGSRHAYTWRLDEGRPAGPPARRTNGSHWIDYQDCQYVARGHALCGGIAAYEVQPLAGSRSELVLGGLALVDLTTFLPVHEVPVPLWVSPEAPFTRNPFFYLDNEDRFFFLPEDDRARLFIVRAEDD